MMDDLPLMPAEDMVISMGGMVRNVSYPFTAPFYAVTAGTDNSHVEEFIDWILSPQGQELVEKIGYVGVNF